MRRTLDDDLLSLVAETNDLRRVAGQSLWLLRTLLLQGEERAGRFADGVRRWASASATALARMEARLRRAGPDGADARLRAFLADLLTHLAEDLAEGDRLRLAFVRTLEARMAELSRLMREDAEPRATFDVGLARDAAGALGLVARGSRADVAGRCRDARARLAGDA